MTRKSTVSALNVMAQNSSALGNIVEKTVTFAAGTTGTVSKHKLADVTGLVMVQVIGLCSTDVAGSGTIEVGTTSASAGLLPLTTGTALDAGNVWHDATPDATIEALTVLNTFIISEDIEYEVKTATLSGGVVKFVICWAPLSMDGNVVIA